MTYFQVKTDVTINIDDLLAVKNILDEKTIKEAIQELIDNLKVTYL